LVIKGLWDLSSANSPQDIRRILTVRQISANHLSVSIRRIVVSRSADASRRSATSSNWSFDEAERIWQVAGIVRLGWLDQFAPLGSRTATELLARLVEETQAADARFTTRWADDQQDDGDLFQ